jgi:hypothetical protein
MEDPLLVEPERLKKWFVELSRQSLAPFTDQYLDKHRAALWLLDRQLLSEANSLLQLPRPVLYSYQADTTSFKTRVQTDTRGNSEQHSLHRRGRELAELLSEKAFLKTIGDDGIAVFMVLCSCARILRDGKTADVHFTALLEFGRKLILEHRWAITLRHHCYDRAVFEPVMRRVIAHRAARYAPEMELLGIVERYEQEPLDIVTGIACAAHDASNSLKWGVARMLREPTWVDDLFIGIESLRNSYVSLYAHLDEHLAKVVLFDGEQTEDFTRKWWSFMGVCVSWLDLFAEVRPYSQGGFLHVNPALLREEPVNSVSKVKDCFVYLMRWRRFVPTRWCGSGPSCRALASSEYMGLHGLVTLTRQDKSVTDFYLHGHSKLTTPVWRYMVATVGGSRPSEAFLLETLEDDRLVRRFDEMINIIMEELQYVEDVEQDVWSALAVVGNCHPHDARI